MLFTLQMLLRTSLPEFDHYLYMKKGKPQVCSQLPLYALCPQSVALSQTPKTWNHLWGTSHIMLLYLSVFISNNILEFKGCRCDRSYVPSQEYAWVSEMYFSTLHMINISSFISMHFQISLGWIFFQGANIFLYFLDFNAYIFILD